MKIRTIEDVIESQLCTGCGACAYMEPMRYRMGNDLEQGMRPFLVSDPEESSGDAIQVCPGAGLIHDPDLSENFHLNEKLLRDWGPVYGVWEGYAVDPVIRFSGSSGGVATALALYCLENEKMDKVLHTAKNENIAYLNSTVLSNTREQLLARTGSRYSPACPAEGLSRIEDSDTQSIFIGKPCDVAAVSSARKMRTGLDENIGFVIAFFCAGVPSTRGTLDLLKLHIKNNISSLKDLRYRGNGWPGLWSATYTNEDGHNNTKQLTYAESWGYLQKYRQWRCYICPDHTGEFADVSVGDPWYREVEVDEPGKSLIIARTQHGFNIINKALEAGYIYLEQENPDLLPRSQNNLIKTRGSLWGRLLSLRIFGAGVPKYIGFSLFQLWWCELTLKEKIQSIFGTVKRVFSKQLYRRKNIREWISKG